MAAIEPAFFKVFANQDCFERIKIPPGYVNYKRGNLPSMVILKDQYGNHWHVQVEKHQNEFFFVKGWKTFVEENHVEIGDFIYFNYHGPDAFDIDLVGKDSAMKEGVGGLKPKAVEEEEENTEDEEGYPEDEVEGEQVDILEVEDCDDDEDEVARYRVEFMGEIQSEEGRASDEKTSDANKSRGAYDKIFQERNISRPKNPYLVTKIRRERRNQMYIPVDFINKHNLDLPKSTRLQDPQGREWNTNLATWEDGRKWYFGGWKDLCKENHVQKSDFLVCEFIKGTGTNKLFLKVQIFRA